MIYQSPKPRGKTFLQKRDFFCRAPVRGPQNGGVRPVEPCGGRPFGAIADDSPCLHWGRIPCPRLCYSKDAMKKFIPLLAITALLSGCATVSYQNLSTLPGETLSVHRTLARYEGVVDQPCRFLTSLCPDRCDHGGRYAKFAIVEYTDYQKPGEYGDPKQETFLVRVAHKDGSPDETTPAPLRKVIGELREGQIVGLDWTHVYVTSPSGSKWPERIVTRLAE